MPRQRSEERTYIPQQIRYQVLSECGGVCAHCGCNLHMHHNFTLEHVIPLNKGGTNDIANFVALCEDCNKAKSDDIVSPQRYYTRLPKDKLKQVQRLFDDYMANTRYLANDTLFSTDQFDIKAPLMIPPKSNSRKLITLPVTLQVSKMRKQAIAEWLLLYTGRLNAFDKELIPYTKEDILTPFYLIQNQKKDLAIISPYIAKTVAPSPIHPGMDERNVLQLDIFMHPETKTTKEHIVFYAHIIDQLIIRIYESIRKHAPGTAIEMMIKTPNSDAITKDVLQTLQHMRSDCFIPFLSSREENPEISAQLYNLNTVLYLGNKKDLDDKELTKTSDEYPLTMNISKVRQSLDDELALSRTIKETKPSKKLTKSQKKRKGKKKKPR